MKKYKVELENLSPYMQHRMDDTKLEEWEKNRKFIIECEDVSKEDLVRAEFHSYSDEEGYYLPSEHLKGAMIGAGALVKSKVGNAKKSMKNIVASMFFIEQEKIRLPKFDAIDKRSAVNRNIKGRIIAIRPKWTKWNAEFVLNIENDTISLQTIKEIIINAGQYIGIGSYRPTNNGWFGKFRLIDIQEIK